MEETDKVVVLKTYDEDDLPQSIFGLHTAVLDENYEPHSLMHNEANEIELEENGTFNYPEPNFSGDNLQEDDDNAKTKSHHITDSDSDFETTGQDSPVRNEYKCTRSSPEEGHDYAPESSGADSSSDVESSDEEYDDATSKTKSVSIQRNKQIKFTNISSDQPSDQNSRGRKINFGPGRIDLSNAITTSPAVSKFGKVSKISGPGRLDIKDAIKAACIKVKSEKMEDRTSNPPSLNIQITDVKGNVKMERSKAAINVKTEPTWEGEDLEEAISESMKLDWSTLPDIAPTKKKDKEFECRICGRKYTHKHTLYKHLKTQFQCDVCQEKFHTLELLSIHRFKIHKVNTGKIALDTLKLEDKEIKVFKGSDLYQEQAPIKKKRGRPKNGGNGLLTKEKMKAEEEVAKKIYLPTKELLKQTSYSPGDGKPGTVTDFYPCDVCGFMYQQKRFLDIHKRQVHPTASDLRTFKCAECDERFLTVEEFKLHRELENHGQSKKRRYEPRQYSCDTCNLSFPSKIYLETHIQNHNPPKKSHTCNICGFGPTTDAELNNHFRICHTNGMANNLAEVKTRKSSKICGPGRINIQGNQASSATWKSKTKSNGNM